MLVEHTKLQRSQWASPKSLNFPSNPPIS